MPIDIIIPILNEEKILTEKKDYYSKLQKFSNVVFVDGGSSDRSIAVAAQYGEVIESKKGRAFQKNFGAKHTQSEFLLFLHVDSFINTKSLKKIVSLLEKKSVAGCFQMKILDTRLIFRLYEWAVNTRAKTLKVLDGDLGLFIRRDVFEGLNGYDQLPVMDDIVFSKRLRDKGEVAILDDAIYVSSRKWHESGFYITLFQYSWAYLKLWFGILRPSK